MFNSVRFRGIVTITAALAVFFTVIAFAQVGSEDIGRDVMEMLRQKRTGGTTLRARRAQAKDAPRRACQLEEEKLAAKEQARAAEQTPATTATAATATTATTPATTETAAATSATAATIAAANANIPSVLDIVPANAMLCVRINNFDYATGQLDAYLAGISPLPMGLSMMARMQLAGILGDPALATVDTNGQFAAFMVMAKINDAPAPSPQVVVMVPVTDYDKFVTANPNVAATDTQGISKIVAAGLPSGELICMAAPGRRYAMVTSPDSGTSLPAVNALLSAGALSSRLSAEQLKDASEAPFWAYIDSAQAATVFGPMAQGMAQMAAAQAQQQQAGHGTPPATDPMQAAMAQSEEIIKLAKQTKSVTIAIRPDAKVLAVEVDIQAIQDSELAAKLSKDIFSDTPPAGLSREAGQFLATINTLKANQEPADKDALAAIRNADTADVIVSFNVMEFVTQAITVAAKDQPQAAMIGMMFAPMAQMMQSNMTMAMTIDEGSVNVQIALPKTHVIELIQMGKMMNQSAPGMNGGQINVQQGVSQSVQPQSGQPQ